MMKTELQQQLQHCQTLPTLPAIAMDILDLGQQPDLEPTELCALISRDPALATRILRVANSPLYSRRRKSDSVQQAIMVLGLNVGISLALSFSLNKLLRSDNGETADWLWRRALIAATAARTLGEHMGSRDLEELFLGALIQDVGILALQAQFPDTYGPLLADAKGHQELIAFESRELGCDHGVIGGWLMRHWGLPERLAATAEASHASEFDDSRLDTGEKRYQQQVALSGRIADLLIDRQRLTDTLTLFQTAEEWLGLDQENMQTLLQTISEALDSIAKVFDGNPLDEQHYQHVMAQAQELRLLRNIRQIEELGEHRRRTLELEQNSRRWREQATRDELTGLHNRRYFNDRLATEFELAERTGQPLTLAFVDLDHFKQVNDMHGHPIGDDVLRRVARTLCECTRETDARVRYGGEEFVILLPGTNLLQACRIVDRMRTALSEPILNSPVDQQPIFITVSIGMAAHMDGHYRVARPLDLVETADKALYRAKREGRNRVELALDEEY